MIQVGRKINVPLRTDDPLKVKLAGEVQNLLLPKIFPTCGCCRMGQVLGGDYTRTAIAVDWSEEG